MSKKANIHIRICLLIGHTVKRPNFWPSLAEKWHVSAKFCLAFKKGLIANKVFLPDASFLKSFKNNKTYKCCFNSNQYVKATVTRYKYLVLNFTSILHASSPSVVIQQHGRCAAVECWLNTAITNKKWRTWRIKSLSI